MKKISFILALAALLLSTLACQTLMGGASAPTSSGFEQPATTAAENNDNSGNTTISGESQYPMPSGAQNVVSTGDTVIFQVNMSLDDAMKFYREEFKKQGITERDGFTFTTDQTFSMVFDGDKSGKAIAVQGVDLGGGSINISITLGDV